MTSRGRQWRSNYILKRAQQFMAKGLYEEAMTMLKEAVSREPMLPDAWCARGVCRLKMENYDATTIECFNRALELRKDYTNAYYNRALCRHKIAFRSIKTSGAKEVSETNKQLLKTAVKDYTDCIRCDRFFSEAYGNRASCYGRLRDTRRAAADLNKAAQCMDNTSDLHKLYEKLMVAKAEVEVGGGGSFAMDGDDGDGNENEEEKIESLWERRRRQRLVRLRKKSISGKDELIMIYKNREKVLTKLGATKKAKEDADKIVKLMEETKV